MNYLIYFFPLLYLIHLIIYFFLYQGFLDLLSTLFSEFTNSLFLFYNLSNYPQLFAILNY